MSRSFSPCEPAPFSSPGPVGVGGVEEGDPRVDRGPHRRGQLVAGLAAALVEGHQAEADRADPQAADRVVPELSCVHASLVHGPLDGSERQPVRSVRDQAGRARTAATPRT